MVMAADLDQAYLRWCREGLSDPGHPDEISVAQMLDHGSISFGRYAVEPLSWEKRSVFTHNKHQEELEKFKSPGLVAKKKAYFEEYYKRIRNLKGLADEQQIEVTLDYGPDSCISSQTGEDDETALQDQAPQKQVDTVCPGICSIEMDREKNCNFNDAVADPIRASTSDQSSQHPEEIRLENISNSISNIARLELDVTTRSCEETIGKVVVENLEKNSSNDSQAKCSGYGNRMSYIDAPERDEEENSLKNNDVFQMEHEIPGFSVHDATKKGCQSAIEPGSSSQVMGAKHLLSETPAHNNESGKLKIPVKKGMELASTPPKKKASTKLIKPEDKKGLNQSGIFQRTKYLQNRMESKERIAKSMNGIENILSRNKNNKLCRSKGHSNVTTPQPFSFSIEKGEVTGKRPSTGLKGSGSGKVNSKSTATCTSAVNSKDKSSGQNISNARSVGSRRRTPKLEEDRQQEAFCRKPVNSSKLKERDGSKERPKPWSINLPPSSGHNLKHNSYSAVGLRVNQEKKMVNKVKETRGIPKPATPPTARKPNTSKVEVKQVVPSRTGDLVLNVKKSRQEVKRWR